ERVLRVTGRGGRRSIVTFKLVYWLMSGPPRDDTLLIDCVVAVRSGVASLTQLDDRGLPAGDVLMLMQSLGLPAVPGPPVSPGNLSLVRTLVRHLQGHYGGDKYSPEELRTALLLSVSGTGKPNGPGHLCEEFLVQKTAFQLIRDNLFQALGIQGSSKDALKLLRRAYQENPEHVTHLCRTMPINKQGAPSGDANGNSLASRRRALARAAAGAEAPIPAPPDPTPQAPQPPTLDASSVASSIISSDVMVDVVTVRTRELRGNHGGHTVSFLAMPRDDQTTSPRARLRRR
ncbi:hypothetical protein B484DRAFT_461539, partial [Ochromonadaceae sp. CCMP2298]